LREKYGGWGGLDSLLIGGGRDYCISKYVTLPPPIALPLFAFFIPFLGNGWGNRFAYFGDPILCLFLDNSEMSDDLRNE